MLCAFCEVEKAFKYRLEKCYPPPSPGFKLKSLCAENEGILMCSENVGAPERIRT